MLITISMLKNFGTHKKGQIVELEADEAESLVENGFAEKIEGDPKQAAVKTAVKEFQEGIRSVIKDEISNATKEMKNRPQVEVVSEPHDRPDGGWQSAGAFYKDIISVGQNGAESELLKNWRRKSLALNETTLADGGAVVPNQYAANILEDLYESSVILDRGTQVPMANLNVYVPAINETTREGHTAYKGGFKVEPILEGQATSASKPKLQQIQMTAKKFATLTYLTEELMEDTNISALDSTISRMVVDSLLFDVDSELINGAGNGITGPQGLLSSPALITVDPESGQSQNTVVFANIAKIMGRMMPGRINRSVWIASPDVLPQLLQMTVGQRAVWLDANTSAVGGVNGSILGRPLIVSEKVPALGSAGCIGLYDLSAYLVGTKGGVKSASSIHVAFTTSETALKFSLRIAGRGWHQSAITPSNGGATLSPFVTIASNGGTT